MTVISRRAVIVCFAALPSGLGGCDTSPDPSASTVRDSVGVRIIESNASLAEASHSCTHTKVPVATIGRDQTGSEYELYQVSSAAFMHDGGIALVNRGTKEIRLFDSKGRFRRSIGRAGEGPGEFSDPIELALLEPDSIAVWDWDLMRISVFTPAGALARVTRISPVLMNPTGHMALLAANEPFIISFEAIPAVIGPEMRDHRLIIARFNRSGVLIDTVATLPFGQRALVNPEIRMVGSPIFVARGAFAAAGDYLYFADGSTPEVRVTTVSGGLHRIVRWRPDDLTVRAADVEAYWNQELHNVAEGWRPILEERRRSLPVAERFPAVAAVVVDGAGSLWVNEYLRPAASNQRWLRFASGGRLECTLSLPRGTTILAAAAELDTEYVEILSLDRR